MIPTLNGMTSVLRDLSRMEQVIEKHMISAFPIPFAGV